METSPTAQSNPTRLSEAERFRLLALAAILSQAPRRPGPACQSLLLKGLHQPLETLASVREWLESEQQPRVSAAGMLRAERLLRSWLAKGFWAARLTVSGCIAGGAFTCPPLLFGLGEVPQDLRLAAFFNSRKPRALSPGAFWLQALRAFVERSKHEPWGIASSLGTLTHDLVTHAGVARSLPVLLLVHDPLDALPTLHRNHGFASRLQVHASMTCQAPGMICPKTDRMLCRDRMLAELAHVHLVLEVRPGGNLHRILKGAHANGSKPLWFATTPREDDSVQTTHEQAAFTITERARSILVGVEEEPSREARIGHRPRGGEPALSRPIRDWSQYLYHYTRGRQGPWPGQTYEAYLESLLEGSPHSGHTVLDSLARILTEGRIRASCKTVRGDIPVVSWTSHAPAELHLIRRWNRALMRWTFEPFGLGVLKSRLKRLGVRPTVYASATEYRRVKESERYRFQRHEPPRICWRQEREYRLPSDLCLSLLGEEELFVFVPRTRDARFLRHEVGYRGALVVIGQHPT